MTSLFRADQKFVSFSYSPPNSSRHSGNRSLALSPGRSQSSGTIEKTNRMSSENPFFDPARLYDNFSARRSITSITSPRKGRGEISKSLNLSDENPFSATYARYQYPSQTDSSKRITHQATPMRSTENKSLNLSDENPFFSTYSRYRYPTQVDAQKRITEPTKSPAALLPTNDTSEDHSPNSYRPLTIREYSIGPSSAGATHHEPSTFSSSIADWVRNHPAPLSYRPIEVQRPSNDFYRRSDLSTSSSYVPPVNQSRQSSSPSRFPVTKSNPSAPLDKTSLNMSPDNPFAPTYGRYHYPSPDEIKAQKKTNEKLTIRPSESTSERETRRTPPSRNNVMAEYPDTENKDLSKGKGNMKFTRFDIDL